jgi:PIN domain nuclease of toxin-antitoxin system
MIVAVADTHTALWYLAADPRLSERAKSFIDDANQNGAHIGISSITFVELVYLIEKRRIPVESLTSLTAELLPTSTFSEIPLDLRIARTLTKVDAQQIPDMPDRIIAATALNLNVPVISRDGRITVSSISTIW